MTKWDWVIATRERAGYYAADPPAAIIDTRTCFARQNAELARQDAAIAELFAIVASLAQAVAELQHVTAEKGGNL